MYKRMRTSAELVLFCFFQGGEGGRGVFVRIFIYSARCVRCLGFVLLSACGFDFCSYRDILIHSVLTIFIPGVVRKPLFSPSYCMFSCCSACRSRVFFLFYPCDMALKVGDEVYVALSH